MKRVPKSILKGFLYLALSGAIGGLILVALFIYLSFDLPDIKKVSDYKFSLPSTILSKDGHVLMEIGKERRYLALVSEVPKVVLDAILAAEDGNFFHHEGVEYLGILRALIENLRAGKVVQGGSTITQQVAKSILGDRSRSVIRKMKDFMLAKRLEERLTKEEILYLYINHVYLGGGNYGLKAAFRGYFNKELNEATAAESALVAGLLVAPGKYSPYVNPLYAKRRQLYVLQRMYETGKLTKEQYDEAVNESIRFNIRDPQTVEAGYFTDWIRQRLMDFVGVDKFLNEGYKVVTTLDWDLQKVAEKAVYAGVKEIDKRQGFSGAIKNLESDEAIHEYELNKRSQLFDQVSTYFIVKPDAQKVLEYNFEEDEVSKIINYWSDESKGRSEYHFVPGIWPQDKLPQALKIGESYEAVVTHVNDKQRAIYVSIGMAKGIIPYENFSWAHPRSISEEPTYPGLVTRPSKIVKRGDVVLVKLIGAPRSPWLYLNDQYRKELKDKALVDAIKKQEFLLCALDQEPEVQGALLSMQPKTGRILAFVGGNDFTKTKFNRVIQSTRQPGSAFKPIIFAAALENGFTPADIILDSPEALGGVDESLNWKPKNYDGEFMGPVTFRKVLEDSRNVPTIKIAETVGIPKLLDFISRIKFKAIIQPDLSMALGSCGISLLDLVSTYAIFPNGGKRILPKSIVSITDRNGTTITLDEAKEESSTSEVENEEEISVTNNSEGTSRDEQTLEKKNPFTENLSKDQVYDPRLAYIMTNLLKGVVLNGTARSAKDVGNFIGGKTGTTSNYVDAWFIGFSANATTGVWTGFDQNTTLGYGETGNKAALPIWEEFMKAHIAKYGEHDFIAPPGIVNVLINRETGKVARGGERNSFMESFAEGTEPGRKKQEEFEMINAGATEEIESILEDDEYYNSQTN